MTHYRRYAIYWAPPAGSALARFGASWLGWDAETGRAPAQPISEPLCKTARIAEEPRRYGFHATVKPPFRLAPDKQAEALDQMIAHLTAMIGAFDAPPLSLARFGQRIALVPSRPSEPLNRLAADLVAKLDEFRAAPGAAEIDARRAIGLSPRQEELLRRWGYPFVLDEFRFHLTLTGRLDPVTMKTLMAELRILTAPFCKLALPITEICLFGEDRTGFFHLLRRYPLSG